MSRSCFLAKRCVLLCATAVPFALLSGCANMITNSPSGPSSELGVMAGKVHGGNQPISGATVKLYAAGTAGYGQGSTLLASTTTSTDGTGSFSFTQIATQPGTIGSSYACPSSKSLIYLVSSGGDPLTNTATNNNTAAVLMAALGQCGSSAGLFVNINEVSTVASVFALAQYIYPGTSTPATVTIGTHGDYTLSTPPQAGVGLINAFATVANLETLNTGAANTSVTLNGAASAVSAVVSTATPETAKINQMANILAACVNNATSAAANCSTLFSNATPPSPSVTSQPSATFSTAVDTLQAAYYMATNPTDSVAANPNNLSNLYALSAAAGAPFQPTLSAAPTDWTIGLVYNSGATKCSSGALFINYPYANSIDAAGNVWMSNGGSGTSGALTEMSPTGVPLNCSGTVFQSRGGAAIDTAGNVWIASNTTAAVYKFDGTTTTTIPTATAKNYAMAADGKGNVFFTENLALNLYELPSTATSSTVPTLIGTTVASGSPFGIGIDTKGTVVVGQSGSGGSTIIAFPTTTVGGSTYPSTGTSITAAGNYAGVYGIAFDATGGFWVGNSAGTSASASTGPGNTTSLTALTYGSSTPGAANTVTFTPGTATAIFAGGVSTGRVVAVDGAGNVWIANNTAASSSGLFGVSEFTKTGVALSPTSTTPGTGTTTTENGGFQKAASFFTSLRGCAIDPSGNVWVSSTNSTSNTQMTEIVGAAVPVVTPISAQLANGTVATKP